MTTILNLNCSLPEVFLEHGLFIHLISYCLHASMTEWNGGDTDEMEHKL